MTTPFLRSSIKLMCNAGIDPVEFHWFDLTGAFSDTQKANLEPLMISRPPFDKCFVVWQGKTKSHPAYEMLMLVAGGDPQEGITVAMWKGPSGTRLTPMPAMFYSIQDDILKYGAIDDSEPVEKDVAELMLAAVGGWLGAMDKPTKAYVPVIQNSFTNRRKISEKKTPTFDWKTVIIEPSKTRNDCLEGTHASPRLHDRRGHLRRLATGKCVWVKACKVGDATKGVVFHDYKIVGMTA